MQLIFLGAPMTRPGGSDHVIESFLSFPSLTPSMGVNPGEGTKESQGSNKIAASSEGTP